MIEVSEQFLVAFKRKRGECNITIIRLAKETNLSRWTLSDILSGHKKIVKQSTFDKLNNWLLKEEEK